MISEVQEAIPTKKKEERILINILKEEILSQIQNSPSSIIPEV